MLKLVIVGAAGFAAGLFVAKLAYEAKVAGGIHDVLDAAGKKFGVKLTDGFVENTIDKLAGV